MLFVQLTISVIIAIFCWDAHVKKYGKELATRDRLFTQAVSQGHNARKSIGCPETRVFTLVALARVNMTHWFNIMTRLASFYRK